MQSVWFDMRLQLVCFAECLHMCVLLRRDHSECICLQRLRIYVVRLQSLLMDTTAANAGDKLSAYGYFTQFRNLLLPIPSAKDPFKLASPFHCMQIAT